MGKSFQRNFFAKAKTAFASFDAHNFVSDLIRGAKDSIVLIDNYIDDSTLSMLGKNQKVHITIHTKTISKTLKLDIEKYNQQYKALKINTTQNFHDRFLIIDKTQIYHIETTA